MLKFSLCDFSLEALVEREWLQAGYPFPQRHARSCYSSSGRNKNHAPTFLLFLDCIQQIHQQYPCSFEFSQPLLILLFEHSYSSQFGEFNPILINQINMWLYSFNFNKFNYLTFLYQALFLAIVKQKECVSNLHRAQQVCGHFWTVQIFFSHIWTLCMIPTTELYGLQLPLWVWYV